MRDSLTQRLLKPVVDLRREEVVTVVLMFLYSFLVMTAYNILKPLTRSQFIRDLGADNLPYVLLVAGVLIGLIMQAYGRVAALLPQRAVISVSQGAMAAVLVGFWTLFRTGSQWVSVGFYLYGLILGILLISQFWTLANDIYDARQAKRVFGFIGGGSSLGGIAGSAILANKGLVEAIGTTNLLLVSASLLVCCAFLVFTIVRRAGSSALTSIASAGEERGVGGGEAIQLLRQSRHLQIISLVIGMAAIGAAIIEQQLNMAAEAFKGNETGAALEAFLGQVQLYLSFVGFIIQIWLTSRIHRYLGIGVALMILPTSLGLTGVVMLFNAVLWAPAAARVLDSALRYTVDKTTREILFLPLPASIKYRAKPFVDVTVDRVAKALGALLILVLIKPWGLGLGWQQLSYASLAMTAVWIWTSLAARKGYLQSFRQSLDRQDVAAGDLRLDVADLSTVETLVEELADPDESRVLYAIDVLESLDKKNLVTPLLLRHESARVRARALAALTGTSSPRSKRLAPSIERLMSDDDADVRAAAIAALASIQQAHALDLARARVSDDDPRVACTAAIALAKSDNADDRAVATTLLERFATETGEGTASLRRDVARAIRHVGDPALRRLLLPLLYDRDTNVSAEALRTVAALGTSDFLFVPTLVSLLRDRRLKSAARDVLVSYGSEVVDALAHFLGDEDEDIWVRRHVPATLARIPTQASMNALMSALTRERDRFLRFKVLAAIERMAREHGELTYDRGALEKTALGEVTRLLRYTSLHHNLVVKGGQSPDALVAVALSEKMVRATDRVFRYLSLLHAWQDISAVRAALSRSDTKVRSSALEYLDNTLKAPLRKPVMMLYEDAPATQRVARINAWLSTRERDVETTLLELINDDDEVLSATAIDFVREHQLWALAADIEHVLAHRDARDWHVFEAASWTLAAHRLPEERKRALWLEPLPAVELAGRVRRLPIFAKVSVDELFRLARAGQQVRHEAGRTLLVAGTVPSAARFLLDGTVETTTRDGHAALLPPPAALGFTEMLEGAPMDSSVRTHETTVCLEIDADDTRLLLADNTDLVQGLFRTALEAPSFARLRVVAKSEGAPSRPLAEGRTLRGVDTLLALQSVPVLAQCSANELRSLLTIARDLSVVPDQTVTATADGPTCLIVLSGTLSIGAAPSLQSAGPGDAVGLLETLAGVPLGADVRGSTAGRVLAIAHDDLFDLLGQRPELLKELFGGVFGGHARVSPAKSVATVS